MTLFAVRLVFASEREDRADIEGVVKSLGDAQPLAILSTLRMFPRPCYGSSRGPN